MLTSKPEAERRTQQRLSWPTPEFPGPLDALLLLVNLETDDGQEVILSFKLSGAYGALAFDRQSEGWWQAGHFSSWCVEPVHVCHGWPSSRPALQDPEPNSPRHNFRAGAILDLPLRPDF
jgi:hypothetical protein